MGMQSCSSPRLQRRYGARLNHFLGSFGFEPDTTANPNELNLPTPHLLPHRSWLQTYYLSKLFHRHQPPSECVLRGHDSLLCLSLALLFPILSLNVALFGEEVN